MVVRPTEDSEDMTEPVPLSSSEFEALAARIGIPPGRLRKIRRRNLVVLVGGCVLLVLWIGVLSVTLPRRYPAAHWRLTWVGFDVFLFAMLALTAYLGFRRRQAVVLASVGTAVLLCCDAWFDVLTATGRDRWFSIASAVFIELPLAGFLMSNAISLLRLTAAAHGLPQRGWSVWRTPMLGGYVTPTIRPVDATDESAAGQPDEPVIEPPAEPPSTALPGNR
jgi:hypothetical protein